MNIPPFYIGQKVITTEHCGLGEGKICIVENISNPIPCYQCEKDTWDIKVNICNHPICENCLSPVQETFQSISLEKFLEEETKLISIN